MILWIQNNLITTLYIALAAVAALLFLNLFSLFKISRINKKLKSLLAGKNGEDLEAIILNQNKEIKTLDKEIQELFDISNKIHNLSLKGLHKVGVIRFNPFKDVGGDQSFSIALLDGKNSGLVISSLFTREGTRVYAKPIIQGQSKKYPMTEEEKQAVKIASPMKNNKV
ncbi:hypothetical protein BMS3Abin15_00415 [bacterium BMS3Abin15]|nr:hypothetical protein BMS3Abin15_00415 [bacterium BMS3Abin15]HDZ85120.1 DUF4446 family protein [Candidatus Moranbacteria bacterium]